MTINYTLVSRLITLDQKSIFQSNEFCDIDYSI